MIYSRHDLEPMEDEVWEIFDKHQREQHRKEMERFDHAEREKHIASPQFQAKLREAMELRRDLSGMYLTTAMFGE